MSIWEKIGRGILGGFSAATDFAEDVAGNAYHMVTGTPNAAQEREKKAQQNAMNEQIKSYKDQTALSQKMLADTQAQKDVERRRINEKQIRALRNSYRAPGGFLNNGSGPTPPAGGLGASPGQPSKLGTS